jgi:5-carboxymethyl-2-hydroxymuconate isomerase
MPHLSLEYTSNLTNLNVNRFLHELNRVLVDSGQFEEIDIKSRAVRFDDFLIGLSPEQRAFVHLKLSIMSGRTMETKRELSGRLLERLRELCESDVGLHVQLCVEVLEIERESYSKSVITS